MLKPERPNTGTNTPQNSSTPPIPDIPDKGNQEYFAEPAETPQEDKRPETSSGVSDTKSKQ